MTTMTPMTPMTTITKITIITTKTTVTTMTTAVVQIQMKLKTFKQFLSNTYSPPHHHYCCWQQCNSVGWGDLSGSWSASAPWSSYNTLPLAEGYKLQVTSSKLQFTCYKLHFTCCKLKVTCYKLVGPLHHDHHTTPCPWLKVICYKFQLKIYKLQGCLVVWLAITHHFWLLAWRFFQILPTWQLLRENIISPDHVIYPEFWKFGKYIFYFTKF